MRRYRKQRQSPPGNGGVYSWGIFFCAVFVGIFGFAARTLGQNDQPEPWRKTVSVDITKPLPQSWQYSISGQQAPTETRLQFSGNNLDWSFIIFDTIPANVSLKVDGDPAGYEESEPVQQGRFYPFKRRLPLIMEIKPEATMPVQLAFWLGRANTGGGEEYLRGSNASASNVRKFADANNLKRDNERLTLRFLWDAPATANASPSPSTSAQSPPPPETSWFANLSDEAIFLLIVLSVLGLAVLVVLGMVVWSKIFARKHHHKQTSRRSVNETLYPGTKRVYDGHNETVTINPPETPQRQQAPPPPPPSPSSQDGKRLEQLIEQKVEPLLSVLNNKADYEDHQRELAETARLLRVELGQIENKLDQRLATVLKEQEEIVLDQGQQMEEKRKEIVSQVAQVNEKGARIIQQVEDLFKELGQVDARLNDRLTKLERVFHTQTVPDSFYATTLGTVLGQNVETLQDGAFQRLIGERLNDLFERGVGRGDGLQELRTRAEGISTAIKEVTSQMTKLNSQATKEASSHIQRVDALVAELSSLQSQLQMRRATIETPLRIPVSLHPGARQTFLDGLGQGIRREIDKLSAPETYFAGELERLITADLIAIVDICDKKITLRPGTNPEIETALNQLFEQADLSQILPQKGEPFKTSEQALIEMAQGSGPSLTIAEVITRGFYYNHGASKTLLRKAGVTVYR